MCVSPCEWLFGLLIHLPFCALACYRSDSKLRSSLVKVPRLDLTPVLAQAEEDQQLEEEQRLLQLEQECQEQQLAEDQHQQQLMLEFSGHEDEQLQRSRTRSGVHDGESSQ
jgi:hypothetical protein